MKKKLSRVSTRYVTLVTIGCVLLLATGIADLFFGNVRFRTLIDLIEIAAAVMLGVVMLLTEKTLRKKSGRYIDEVITKTEGEISSNAMTSLPIPAAVTHADGVIQWYNSYFAEMFDVNELHGTVFSKLLPAIKWGDILRKENTLTENVLINDRRYDIISKIIKTENGAVSAKELEYSVYLYFIDRTRENKAVTAYLSERTDVAVICIDNYDELFQKLDDMEQQRMMGYINNIINDWAEESRAVLKKVDRDRYYMLFEHRYLEDYKKSGFEIVKKVREKGDELKLPVSVTVGIGAGNDLKSNELAARTALEMAQGRGGDQVGISDKNQYSFFGSRNIEYEKSSRVKTRAVASALKKYILDADMVFLLGHKSPDYDCFGAAMGLQSAVRALGKTPHILIGEHTESIRKLYDTVYELPEYRGLFIDEEEALRIQTKSSLTIVLDTHRPSMVESLKLVERSKTVVLIDHHRRAPEMIENCSLIYQEPYASSTCEMVTEIIQYMDTSSAITQTEIECLYAGILLDTKNFLVKTGVRTFDAASYLRRLGLNTFEVKKLFTVDKTEYERRAAIVNTAVEAAPGCAIAYAEDSWPNIRVIASQAADDMLNINSVKASFVVYPCEGRTCISARSIGNVNVHTIMEELGGGGHATVAAAQRGDVDIQGAVELLKQAINNYVENNK